MQENEQLNPEELQAPKLATLPVDPTASEEKKVLEDMSPEELERVKTELQNLTDELNADDLDKRNYVKVSPTFYLQTVKNEDEDDETELFKILNPEEGTVETRELTEDEQKELLIAELKRSKQVFNPLSHPSKVVGFTSIEHPFLKDKDGNPVKKREKNKEYQTNITKNKFDDAYKAKRKRKNKLKKTSRKANR